MSKQTTRVCVYERERELEIIGKNQACQFDKKLLGKVDFLPGDDMRLFTLL